VCPRVDVRGYAAYIFSVDVSGQGAVSGRVRVASVAGRPQAAENSPYPPKLYLPPKIRRKKYGLAGYQPNFDEELAAGKIPAKIRLIGLVKNC